VATLVTLNPRVRVTRVPLHPREKFRVRTTAAGARRRRGVSGLRRNQGCGRNETGVRSFHDALQWRMCNGLIEDFSLGRQEYAQIYTRDAPAAVKFFLHLGLGRRPNVDDRHATDQRGKPSAVVTLRRTKPAGRTGKVLIVGPRGCRSVSSGPRESEPDSSHRSLEEFQCDGTFPNDATAIGRARVESRRSIFGLSVSP
jgi:hypothetical protein